MLVLRISPQTLPIRLTCVLGHPDDQSPTTIDICAFATRPTFASHNYKTLIKNYIIRALRLPDPQIDARAYFTEHPAFSFKIIMISVTKSVRLCAERA